MAQQEGPFSQYLDQSAAASFKPSPVPQPTGLEGTGAAIGNIAMNFINGLRQGRMQKYAMQEAEREKQFNAYQQAIKTVAASDLPDQEKQRLHAQLSLPLIQNIAGDKEATSKHTGNPLTNVVKHIATGIIGGNLPKKGAPLSMEPVVTALQAASDPSRSKTQLQSQFEGKIRSRVKSMMEENPYLDSRAILKDSEIGQTIGEAEKILGPYDSPYLRQLRGELKAETPQEAANLAALKAAGLITSGKQAPPITPAPVVAPKQSTGTPQSPSTAVPPMSTDTGLETEPKTEIQPIRLDPKAMQVAQRASMVPSYSHAYQLNPNTVEFERNGKRIIGQQFQGVISGTPVSGILDVATNTLYPPGSLTKQLRPGEHSEEEVGRMHSSVIGPLQEILKNASPETQKAILKEAEGYRESKNTEGLKRILDKGSDAVIKEAEAKKRAIEAEKVANRGNERFLATLDGRERQANNKALTSASTAYLNDPRKKALNELSTQYDSFIGDLANLDIQGYLANPKGYKKKDGTPVTQADLTLMDKSMARLISKMTDDRSAVKEQEERGYNNLVGMLQKAGININSVISGGSTLGNDETRRALFGVISSIRRSMQSKANQVKEERKASISHLGIDPNEVNKSFGDLINVPDRRTATGGTPAPPSGGTVSLPEPPKFNK